MATQRVVAGRYQNSLRKGRRGLEIMTSGESKQNLIQVALEIVADYSRFIEATPDAVTCICDERILPHPKNRIVDACCLSMLAHQSAESREQLIVKAISLARFQPNVGEPLHSFGMNSEKTGAEEIESMPSDEFWKVTKNILEQKRRYESLLPTVQKEIYEIGQKIKIANSAYNRKFHPGITESD